MIAKDLPDPRTWPSAGPPGETAARLHADAQRAIEAPTRREADLRNADATRAIESSMRRRDGRALAAALETAPSMAIARHLWRLVADVERGERSMAALRATLVALPVILVAALEDAERHAVLPAILSDRSTLETLLRVEREFGGCEAFALSPALTAADAIDVAALPELLARCAVHESTGGLTVPPLDFAPASIEVRGTQERVHLRFLIVAVLTPPGLDPLGQSHIGRWGMRFAQNLASQLTMAGVSLLALPRPPLRLVAALIAGRAAQREMSAQIFASNAIRRLRASFGEPTAIISAHRAADAPGGGELRLSLSTPFAPRAAEGFRCPLYPYETVHDVAAMLIALLRDCRIGDVRVQTGIHADVDPATGGPLLFKDAGSAPATAH